MARGTLVPAGNEEYHGEKYHHDPNFNGPIKSRSCTDIICLFLFMIMIGCSLGVALYAYVNGDPQMLLAPKDSKGSRCGLDAHVADKPYLVFFDLTKCLNPNVPFTRCNTEQVCVRECPNEFFLFDDRGANLNNIVCVDNYRPRDRYEAERLVKEGKCARWLLPSNQVLGRCIPLLNNGTEDLLRKIDISMTIEKVRSGVQSIEFITNSEQVGHDIVEDIKASYPEILGGLALAVAMCIIYITVMRWIAFVMVWISIIGSLIGLGFCTYLCGVNYTYYKDHKYEYEMSTNAFDRFTKTADFWLALLIILCVILVILLFVVVFLRKRIVLAIGLIKEGSKAITATTSALFFPIIPWILQMLVVIYAISVSLYLAAVGSPIYQYRNTAGCCPEINIKDGNECDPDKLSDIISKCPLGCSATCPFIEMDNPAIIPYTHAFNIFCFFWLVFFMQALGEMILASTFATWYWTFDKSRVPFFNITNSTGRVLRYHIGTLAFGSLIIAICRMIRVALEYIDHKLKQYENPVTKAILCCMKCFFWCLENFLKFINKNAYIMCAIHGKNFCTSAKDAFSLLLRNIVRVFVLDKVVDFLFVLSKLLVTIGVSAIVYSFIEFVSDKELHYPYVPVCFTAVCTYLVASVFFSVYTMAVDTLFLCFLEDCERNDGSAEKPYFMSKNLMNVLGKKNKTS